MKGFALWFAQGFGVGRIAVAPGTFGSVIGIGWFALLMCFPSEWFYLVGCLAGIGASIFFCGMAENYTGKKDPPSVVLDEIAALPVCFAGWAVALRVQQNSWPALEEFFGPKTWAYSLGIFVAFRFFDVVKPWPIGASQRLPGGWGITIDDLLAALYVNGCSLLAFFWLR